MQTIKATNRATGAVIECKATTAALVLAMDYADGMPRTRTARTIMTNAAWAYLSLCHSGQAAGMGVVLCPDPRDHAQLEASVLDMLAKYDLATESDEAAEDAGEDGDGGKA